MVCTRSYRNYSDHAYKIQVVVEVDSLYLRSRIAGNAGSLEVL